MVAQTNTPTPPHFLDALVLPESAVASYHTRELRAEIVDWLKSNGVTVKMGGYFKYLRTDVSAEKLAQLMFRDKTIGYEVETGKDDPPTRWKLATEREIKADLDHLGLGLFATAVERCGELLVNAPAGDDAELRRALRTIVRADLGADKDEYYVIAIKQLVWQVKQKLAGRRSQHDVFVLFYSLTQGSGKTTWVTKFGSVLGPLFMEDVDFEIFRDKFRIKAFNRYYLAFIDEMAKASQKDLGAVKKAITKQKVGGREMHSDNDLSMDKNINFVAASNRRLIEDLQDPSGVRRWIEIDCVEEKIKDDPARQHEMNSIDWRAVWNCVHVDDPSPYAAGGALVSRLQDENITSSDFDAYCGEFLKPCKDSLLKSSDVYTAFCAFVRTAGREIPSIQVFSRWVKVKYTTRIKHSALYIDDIAFIVAGE